MSNAIVIIGKLLYQAIIMSLYLKGLKSRQVYNYIGT